MTIAKQRLALLTLCCAVILPFACSDGGGGDDDPWYTGTWSITETVTRLECPGGWRVEPITVTITDTGDGKVSVGYDCSQWRCAGQGTVDGDAIDFWTTTDSRYQGRREGEGLMRGTATHTVSSSCRADTDWTAVRAQ